MKRKPSPREQASIDRIAGEYKICCKILNAIEFKLDHDPYDLELQEIAQLFVREKARIESIQKVIERYYEVKK